MSTPIVLITGASRGLGLAVFNLLLTKFNARVSAVSRTKTSELEAAVDKFGQDRVLISLGDLNDPEVSKRVVKDTVDKFGGLDSVILNAGTLDPLGASRRTK
jgi:NAD(P)-dependent dehydrogenase (short-subunit alcohol dehydrogenase family)